MLKRRSIRYTLQTDSTSKIRYCKIAENLKGNKKNVEIECYILF